MFEMAGTRTSEERFVVWHCLLRSELGESALACEMIAGSSVRNIAWKECALRRGQLGSAQKPSIADGLP
jgi:hypothetical protein